MSTLKSSIAAGAAHVILIVNNCLRSHLTDAHVLAENTQALRSYTQEFLVGFGPIINLSP